MGPVPAPKPATNTAVASKKGKLYSETSGLPWPGYLRVVLSCLHGYYRNLGNFRH